MLSNLGKAALETCIAVLELKARGANADGSIRTVHFLQELAMIKLLMTHRLPNRVDLSARHSSRHEPRFPGRGVRVREDIHDAGFDPWMTLDGDGRERPAAARAVAEQALSRDQPGECSAGRFAGGYAATGPRCPRSVLAYGTDERP